MMGLSQVGRDYTRLRWQQHAQSKSYRWLSRYFAVAITITPASFSGRCHPQDPSCRIVGQQPQRAIRALADVADALVEIWQQPLFAGHGVAVDGEPHQHLADQRAGEQAAVPLREEFAGVERRA